MLAPWLPPSSSVPSIRQPADLTAFCSHASVLPEAASPGLPPALPEGGLTADGCVGSADAEEAEAVTAAPLVDGAKDEGAAEVATAVAAAVTGGELVDALL